MSIGRYDSRNVRNFIFSKTFSCYSRVKKSFINLCFYIYKLIVVIVTLKAFNFEKCLTTTVLSLPPFFSTQNYTLLNHRFNEKPATFLSTCETQSSINLHPLTHPKRLDLSVKINTFSYIQLQMALHSCKLNVII